MQKYLQYYAKLREKYEKLMEGRHGFDTLGRDLLILWFITGFLNGFIRSRIITLLSLLCPLTVLLRMFSTNSVKRSKETRKYLELKENAAEFFKLSYRKFQERKTHKYYHCKNCSANIRVKRVKGEHTVVCPKCGKEFRVKIR